MSMKNIYKHEWITQEDLFTEDEWNNLLIEMYQAGKGKTKPTYEYFDQASNKVKESETPIVTATISYKDVLKFSPDNN